MILEALQLESFQVTACVHGQEALKRFQPASGQSPYVLVVLDLMLPGLNGLAAAASCVAMQTVPRSLQRVLTIPRLTECWAWRSL